MRLLRRYLAASLYAATIATGAPIVAQAATIGVTIDSLSASPSASPGETVTFSARLTANQSVSDYPIEFSWLGPGGENATNGVKFVSLAADQAATETYKMQLPADTSAGIYILRLNVYNPSWSVPSLAAAKTTFEVGASTAAQTPPPGPKPVNGTCGSTNGVPSNTAQTGAPCPAATASATSGDGDIRREDCAHSNDASTAPCPAPPPSKTVTYTLETTVQPGPNAALYASPFYSCVRNFYVSTTGSDSNAGTSSSPWLTIQHADSTSRQAGDCINVAAGTYKASVLIQHGGNAPTPTGYIAYRCETLDGCHVLAQSGGHLWGFEQPANFVVVDGFELDGNSALGTPGIADACIDTDGDTYGAGNASHHIWALNNLIHNCNESGVQFNNKEWFYVINNTIYNNSGSSGYQGSGLSLVVVQCIESGNASCASGSGSGGNAYAGGTGTYTPLGHGSDLRCAVPQHHQRQPGLQHLDRGEQSGRCGNHTDGNGIIMDTFLDETKNSIVYPFQTLVGGNVSYANGGRGIHVFRTSNVTVANNTVYGNGNRHLHQCLLHWGSQPGRRLQQRLGQQRRSGSTNRRQHQHQLWSVLWWPQCTAHRWGLCRHHRQQQHLLLQRPVWRHRRPTVQCRRQRLLVLEEQVCHQPHARQPDGHQLRPPVGKPGNRIRLCRLLRAHLTRRCRSLLSLPRIVPLKRR